MLIIFIIVWLSLHSGHHSKYAISDRIFTTAVAILKFSCGHDIIRRNDGCVLCEIKWINALVIATNKRRSIDRTKVKVKVEKQVKNRLTLNFYIQLWKHNLQTLFWCFEDCSWWNNSLLCKYNIRSEVTWPELWKGTKPMCLLEK